MAAKKKTKKRVASPQDRLLSIVQNDETLRKKLYAKFGRVRCYLYKYGRSIPNEKTAKVIEKITGIPASAWAA